MRRLTFTERVADWMVGGDYSRALALKDRAVQTAARSAIRDQHAADLDDDRTDVLLRPADRVPVFNEGGRHRWHG